MEGSKKYSLSEVSLHSSKDDCWLSIHGKVYDVTTFLDDHPGGEEVLVKASAEEDATQIFEDVGHSSTAISMMKSYEIGFVDGYIPKEPTKPAEFIPLLTQPSSLFSDFFLPIMILGTGFAWYYCL